MVTGGKESRLYIRRLETENRGHIGGSRDYVTGSGAKTWFYFLWLAKHVQVTPACITLLILRGLRALRKMAVRWWLVMMTGELLRFAWRLETTLAKGGRVNRGDLGYNITSENTQSSRRSKKR